MPYISKIKIGEQSYDIKDKLFRDYLDEIKNTDKKNQPIRILGIGNSIFRDSVRYLYRILEDAGYTDIVIGHLYKGGANLSSCYKRFNDEKSLYRQEYWKYSSNNKITPDKYYCEWPNIGNIGNEEDEEDEGDTPLEPINVIKQIPNAEYGGEKKGIHLKDVLLDEDWNIIIFQQKLNGSYKFNTFHNSNTDINFYLKNFITEIKDFLIQKNKDINKIKFGLQISWQNLNDSDPDNTYENIQNNEYRVARWCNLDFTINSGKAIKLIRENKNFYNPIGKGRHDDMILDVISDVLYDGTHPLPGIVRFLLSYQFAYTLFNVKPNDITFYPSDEDIRREDLEITLKYGSAESARPHKNYINEEMTDANDTSQLQTNGVLAQQAKQYAILASQP